jgi:MFS family permease
MTVSTATRGRGGVRQALAMFNWSIGVRSAYDAAVNPTGFVFVGFALALGIAKERMGLLASAASLASLGQLLGLLALNAARDKKRFVLGLSVIEPAIFLATLCAAVFAPPAWRFPLIVTGVLCGGLLLHTGNPMAQEWLAALIPPGLRGRYLGLRMQVTTVAAITVTLLLGFAAERLKWFGVAGYAGILVTAVLFGLLAVVPLLRAHMPAASHEARVDWATLPEVLRTRPFWGYLAAMLLYACPFWLVGPYYQVYNLKVLVLPESLIAGLMVGYYLIKILLFPYVGKWVDRLGVRRSLLLVAPCYVLFFICYLLSGPAAPWLVFLGWTVVGVGDAVFGVAGAVALYRVVPDTPARPAFFAVNTLLSMICAAASAALATALVGALAATHLTIGPLTLGPYQCFFGLGMLLYVACLFGVRLMPGKAA